jgi:5-deoxy-5-amino-3-dehydroquinate synthase
MSRFEVAVSSGSYDVVVARHCRQRLFTDLELLAPHAKKAVVITTNSVAHLWPEEFTFRGERVERLLLEDGEAAKTYDTVATITSQLARWGLSRRDVVVAIGGGALTDVAGFAAATYMRGISFVNVPTTLAGQVDAAIGGKTGINIPEGKNLVGAFHQPLAVYCDPEFLTTLPERDMVAGMGEVAKCWLLEGRDATLVSAASLEDLVALAVALKARIVSADEFEQGPRALLNYGHTLAHALEQQAFGDAAALRHGEAVAMGLAFAVRLARALGRVDDAFVSETDAVLNAFGLSSVLPGDVSLEVLVEIMARDKKANHDLTFVLPGAEGFAVVAGISSDTVLQALMAFRSEHGE